MRRLGIVRDRSAAQRFAEYLRTQRIEVRTEEQPEGTEFWIYDEDRLNDARAALDRCLDGSLKTPAVTAAAASLLVNAPVRRSSPSSGWSWFCAMPLTLVVCALCIAATLATGFFQIDNWFSRTLGAIPMIAGRNQVAWNPADDDLAKWMALGQIWRVFTPALLHGNILHLAFNLQWFYLMGGIVERTRRSWRLAGLTFGSAVVSNVIQYWWGGPAFCGLSGVVYALYGYFWMKATFQPELRLRVSTSTHVLFGLWTLFCFTGLLPVANAAHLAGLASGILFGLIPFL